MRVALVYNVLESVSGETIFFQNMVSNLRGRGMEIIQRPVAHPRLDSLSGQFDFYTRMMILRKTRDTLRETDADVIHFMNSALCPAWKPDMGAPALATNHFMASSYHRLSPPANPAATAAESLYCRYVRLLDRKAFGSMSRLVACSPFQRDEILRDYSLGPAKVRSIPPGIDNRYFSSIRKRDLRSEFGCEKAVAFFGRLHERSKGVSYLIRAMEHVDARLLIVGEGPDGPAYRRLARKLGLEKKVSFLGKLGFDEKSRIQKSADAIAIPSLFEAYGTVFAESLSCGVPVVAFDMPFWKGLYDGAALFTAPRDAKALAEGICSALDGPDKGMLRRGAEISIKHDISATVESYAALYSEICGE